MRQWLVSGPLWMPVLMLAGAFVLGLLAQRWLLRILDRRRRRVRALRAGRAERRAEKLLRAAGYQTEERQVRRQWPVLLDGDPRTVELRADLIVNRQGERLVVEVKNGIEVATISHGPTRRQLLEYQLAFGCSGILLVDMQRRLIHRVAFPDCPIIECTS